MNYLSNQNIITGSLAPHPSSDMYRPITIRLTLWRAVYKAMQIVTRRKTNVDHFVDTVIYICQAITSVDNGPFFGDVVTARHLYKKSKFWGESSTNVVRLQVASDILTSVEAQFYKIPWFTFEMALKFLETIIKLKEGHRAKAHRIWARDDLGFAVAGGGIHAPLFNTVVVDGQEIIL